MDSRVTLFVILLLVAAGIVGGLRLYIMINFPEGFRQMFQGQLREQELCLRQQEIARIAAERHASFAGIGVALLMFFKQ